MYEESVHNGAVHNEAVHNEAVGEEALSEDPVSDVPGSDEQAPPDAAEVIGAWRVPADARRARVIKAALLGALEHEGVGPELVADMAVGPLVEALAQLEIELADARRRIEELERAAAGRAGDRAW